MLQPRYGGAFARPFATHHNELDQTSICESRPSSTQAPDRRRAGARLRAGQGLPQRGHLVQAQSRVHDGRVVRGLRRLPRSGQRLEEVVQAAAEAGRSGGRAGRSGGVGDLTEATDISSAAGSAPLVDAVEKAKGIDLDATGMPTLCGRAIEEKGLELQTEGQTWPALADALLSKYVEPSSRSRPSSSTTRSSSRPSPASTRRRRVGRALRGLHRRRRGRQRLQRARRSRRAGQRFEAQRRLSGSATTRRSPTTSYRRGPRAGHAADRRGRVGDRPPGDGADGTLLDPRGGALPGHASVETRPGEPKRAGRQL